MSVEAMALVLHHSKAKGTDKVILLGIANHAGDGGAWPAVATLARYANVTERAVQDALRRLESAGEVQTHQQGGGTTNVKAWQRPNRYDVLIACPVTCDRTANHRLRPPPAAPADLWIEGVKPTSPGEAHFTGGVKPTSPGGVKPTSPEPSIEPPTEDSGTSPTSTTDHAREALEAVSLTCSVCSRRQAECQRREAISGHTFTPRETA